MFDRKCPGLRSRSVSTNNSRSSPPHPTIRLRWLSISSLQCCILLVLAIRMQRRIVLLSRMHSMRYQMKLYGNNTTYHLHWDYLQPLPISSAGSFKKNRHCARTESGMMRSGSAMRPTKLHQRFKLTLHTSACQQCRSPSQRSSSSPTMRVWRQKSSSLPMYHVLLWNPWLLLLLARFNCSLACRSIFYTTDVCACVDQHTHNDWYDDDHDHD